MESNTSRQHAMLNLITGFQVSQLIFVAAELGIADRLAKGPKTCAVLAKQLRVHPDSLYRVLRALAGSGVFAEDGQQRFRLTPLAQTLRSDRPDSLRDYARMMLSEFSWRPWGELLNGVKSGEPIFNELYGMSVFDYLKQQPQQERVYSASMAALSTMQNKAIARAYPFGEAEKLVDVGGAHGHLLAAILQRHRPLRGVLFDQPSVIAAAKRSSFFKSPALRNRCEFVGGSFFDFVPEDADVYILKQVIHDWNDEDSIKILTRCRAAMRKGGRVLIADNVIAAANRPDVGKLIDIHMMLIGGRERTREEFRDLLRRAKLKLKRVIPTGTLVSVIEAVAM